MTHRDITLLIEGHGNENVNIPIALRDNIKLLSFPCNVGSSGLLELVDKVSLEIIVLNYLIDTYGFRYNDQASIFNSQKLVTDLRNIYADAGIKYDGGGFCRNLPPRHQRTFFFKPNDHENCRSCGVDRGELCLPVRDLRKQYCPVYGLIIVDTNNPVSKAFTLTNLYEDLHNNGNNMNVTYLNRPNLHQNKTTRLHWYNNIPKTDTTNQALFTNMIEQQEVTLTNLVSIFQSMGYNRIHILDPSCRTLVTDTTASASSASSAVVSVAPMIMDINGSTSETTSTNTNTNENANTNMWSSVCKAGTKCWENMFGKRKIDGGKRITRKTNRKNKKRTNKQVKKQSIRRRK